MDSSKPDEILESTIKSDDWQVELERVLPQLKVTIKTGKELCLLFGGIFILRFESTVKLFFFTDSRDWRNHLEQMQKHRSGIQENLTITKSQLDKLYEDITNTLDKISSREKYLNSHLEPLLLQYRSKQVCELKKTFE